MTNGGTWYVSIGGQAQGPFPDEQLAEKFRQGEINGQTYVYRQGMASWALLEQVPELGGLLAPAAAPPQPPPAAAEPAHLRPGRPALPRSGFPDLRRRHAVRGDRP